MVFVTGNLAASAMTRVLAEMGGRGAGYRVLELPISVAALMTVPWAAERIRAALGPELPSKIVMPGRMHGDMLCLEEVLGIAVERGPDDLWDIPAWCGMMPRRDLPESVKPRIMAEIVDAWRLSPSEVVSRAKSFREAGADIIDLGGTPDGVLHDAGAKVRRLKELGFAVSVDAFGPSTLLEASEAGADLLLSVNSSNFEILGRVRCPVVVIPDFGSEGSLASLERNVEIVRAAGCEAIADPVLSPPLFGLSDSLARYREYSARVPDTPILMGTGNVTELLEADSTGVNALLAALVHEMSVDYVLTAEVAEWTRGTVRELCAARSMMAIAGSRGGHPKGVSGDLRLLKARGPRYNIADLREMQKCVRDENWRVFVAEGHICAFNCRCFICAKTPEEVFASMDPTDPRHAFYIGRELERAAVAVALSRDYVQDNPLRWGGAL